MGERLKIVQITGSGNRSGGTRQAFLLSRGLRDAGHEVLFCAPCGSIALRWAQEAGLETRPLTFGNIAGQWRASRVLREVVSAFGADVVHAHHTKGHNVALLATFGAGFPPVVVNRGVLFPADLPWKFRTRRIAAVTTNSGAVKQVLTGQGVAEGKIHVVHNAKEAPDLDLLRGRLPALREELRLPAGAWPIVGTVGSGRPEKGFSVLVDAAPRVLERFPDAVFVLVGSGTLSQAEQVARLGVGERFRIPGHRGDATDLMGLFDLFVLPSVGMDSSPNVLLEAMGAAVPAVASDVGGVREILADGAVGRVVPPGDAEALARAAIEVLSLPDRGADLGGRARARVLDEFTLPRKSSATIEVYRRVLAAK